MEGAAGALKNGGWGRRGGKDVNGLLSKTKIYKKEVKQMVELDLFKQKLNTYKQPLVEVRDSL